MKSWRFHGTGQPLTLEEVPDPHAGPGEVVVVVKAAGLCHSDVGALDDPQWHFAGPHRRGCRGVEGDSVQAVHHQGGPV